MLVLVAKIIPSNKEVAEIQSFNEQLNQIVSTRSSSEQPVKIRANLFNAFELASMSYDGIHPNTNGDHYIGNHFANALLAY